MLWLQQRGVLVGRIEKEDELDYGNLQSSKGMGGLLGRRCQQFSTFVHLF
jgi:hypothetical protein